MLYDDELIGSDTVNTLPEPTLEAFADHGTVARRVDADVDESAAVWAALPSVGVDMDDVADQLEREGVASFISAFDELIEALKDMNAIVYLIESMLKLPHYCLLSKFEPLSYQSI